VAADAAVSAPAVHPVMVRGVSKAYGAGEEIVRALDGVTVDHGCLASSGIRCDWSPKMLTKGYVAADQVSNDRQTLRKAELAITKARWTLDNCVKYGVPMETRSLQSAVEIARVRLIANERLDPGRIAVIVPDVTREGQAGAAAEQLRAVDLDVEPEGHGQCVEARTEVGRRRRGASSHRTHGTGLAMSPRSPGEGPSR